MAINLGVKALLSWVSPPPCAAPTRPTCRRVFSSSRQQPRPTVFAQVNSLRLSDRELSISDLQDGTVLLRVVLML